MSNTLMALDFDETPSVARIHAALEASETDLAAGVTHAPSEKLGAFARDVADFFPSLEADPDSSPWSMTPSGQADMGGRCLSYGVGKMDLLFDVLMEFEEIAWRHDVILFDPQEGSVRRPRTE